MTDPLKEEITNALYEVKAQRLPAVCSALGLAAGTEEEAFRSKRSYVLKRIEGIGRPELIALAVRVAVQHRTFGLEEQLEVHQPSVAYRIDEITRKALVRDLDELGNISGELDMTEFLKRVWPLAEMPRADADALEGCTSMEQSINRHLFTNDGKAVAGLLKLLNVEGVSDMRFGKLLELVVAPVVRNEESQRLYANRINTRLSRIGYELRPVDEQAGYPVYRIVAVISGVSGRAKNLIFAADGPKPELVLSDAVNNDIKIVKNAEHCLVFDDPIPSGGLMWKDLVAWWAKKNGMMSADRATAVHLYKRLARSLASPPEKVLFAAYFRSFSSMGDRLPALVPQVYLHYDPYTQRQLGVERRLPRQRMDFLLLLSHFNRIVIEVDGKQHYADENQASPSRYAEMVGADRDLKLAGYEVYRFGGAELDERAGPDAVTRFFRRLFDKYHRG